jgi:dolichol-phosphate mannosyltransferase
MTILQTATGALAERITSVETDRVFVLHRERKEGLGPAYVEGFRFALARDYEAIVQMDADFSHDPKYLPAFFRSSTDERPGNRFPLC